MENRDFLSVILSVSGSDLMSRVTLFDPFFVDSASEVIDILLLDDRLDAIS